MNEEHQSAASAVDPEKGAQRRQAGATPETSQRPPPVLRRAVDGPLVAKLESLFELKCGGLLTGDEFQEQKRRLFEEGRP